jgi:hypothetical protein
MIWTGRLPLTSLTSGLVSPGRYATWDECRRDSVRNDTERERLDDLRRVIGLQGVRTPLRLALAPDSPAVLMDDGQHRALVAMDLRLAWLPVQWRWLRFGARPEHEAPPVDVMDLLGMEES